MVNRDLGAGLLMLAMGLLIIFVLIPFGVREPASVQFAALAPSYYPRIVAIALTAIGAAITVRSVIRPPAERERSSCWPRPIPCSRSW